MPALDVAARLQADAEEQTAARELVQRRGLKRHRHRRAAPDADYAGAEQEARGLERSPRRRPERVPEGDLRKPRGAEAALLGPHAVVDLQARRERLHEDVDAVQTDSPPLKICSGIWENPPW